MGSCYISDLFYDVHSRCLEEVYPGTGARVNGAECPMLYAHSQYFYNSDGHKCHVYETINC